MNRRQRWQRWATWRKQDDSAAAAPAGISGIAAITLGALTLSATGLVKVQGTLSVTLDALTLSATGTVVSATTDAPLFRAVARNQANVGAGGTLAVNKPTGTVDGDLILVVATTSSTVTHTPPAGGAWTLVDSHNETGGGSGNKISVYSHTASSEGSSYTWTFPAFSVASLIAISWYSNTGRTLIVAGTPTHQSNDVSGTTQTAPSMTTTVANSILHCCFALSGASVVGTPHSGMDERSESPGSTGDYLMTETIAVAGATGTRTMTHTGNMTSAAISFAIAESV